eukprot:3831434-Prymnesium_polylepis.1
MGGASRERIPSGRPGRSRLWIGRGKAQVLGREQATPAWWRCKVSFTRLVEAARRHHSFKP